MDWSQLLGEIESQEFAVRLNVASTRRVFLVALKAEPAFLRLTALLRETPALGTRVLRRVATLAGLDFDLRYEHPYDSALAAYAWALAAETPEAARIAAELLISTRQTLWAREIAHLILEAMPASTTDSETHNLTTTEPGFERRQPRAAMDSGEVFESMIVWSVLSRRPNLGCLAEVQSRKADTPYDYTGSFLWPHRPSIRDMPFQHVLYSTRLPYLAETTAEWSH